MRQGLAWAVSVVFDAGAYVSHHSLVMASTNRASRAASWSAVGGADSTKTHGGSVGGTTAMAVTVGGSVGWRGVGRRAIALTPGCHVGLSVIVR